VRLNNSTELLVDIEEAGGAALRHRPRLAGNTDLDIVRNPLFEQIALPGARHDPQSVRVEQG